MQIKLTELHYLEAKAVFYDTYMINLVTLYKPMARKYQL